MSQGNTLTNAEVIATLRSPAYDSGVCRYAAELIEAYDALYAMIWRVLRDHGYEGVLGATVADVIAVALGEVERKRTGRPNAKQDRLDAIAAALAKRDAYARWILHDDGEYPGKLDTSWDSPAWDDIRWLVAEARKQVTP
jgi:hypothetical protein